MFVVNDVKKSIGLVRKQVFFYKKLVLLCFKLLLVYKQEKIKRQFLFSLIEDWSLVSDVPTLNYTYLY